MNELDRVKLQAGFKIFNIDRLAWAKLVGAYKVGLRRSEPGTYLRSDHWRLNHALLPLEVLTNDTGALLPLRLHLNAGAEVEFIRTYSTRAAALRALPKTPLQMPLTAVAALKLDAFEVVRLPASLGLHLGFGQDFAPRGYGAGASAGVFWLGNMQISIMRLEGNLVRLRLNPIQERGHLINLYAGARLQYFGYGPFGLVNLDREISKQLGLDIVHFVRRTTTLGDSFAFDYTYDLGDHDAAAAYDAMLHNTLQGVHPELLKLAVGNTRVGDLTFADLTLTERLARDDQSRSDPRVRQNVQGGRDFSTVDQGGHFGTNILRWQNSRLAGTNHLLASDEQGKEVRFSYLQSREQKRQKSLIEPMREGYFYEASAMLRQNEVDGMIALTFVYDVEDKLLTTQEVSDFLGVITAMIGEDRLQQLPIANALPRTAHTDFHGEFLLALPGNYLQTLRELARRDLESYERLLWQAMASIVDRVEKRHGLSTPGEATSILSRLNNAMKSSMLTVRQSLTDGFRLRWGGVHGATARDLIEAMMKVADSDDEVVLQDLLWLVRKDALASEILPAFSIEIVSLLRNPNVVPFAVLRLQSEEFPGQESAIGNNSMLEERNRVLELYQRLTIF